jgi:hypothetical protein
MRNFSHDPIDGSRHFGETFTQNEAKTCLLILCFARHLETKLNRHEPRKTWGLALVTAEANPTKKGPNVMESRSQ